MMLADFLYAVTRRRALSVFLLYVLLLSSHHQRVVSGRSSSTAFLSLVRANNKRHYYGIVYTKMRLNKLSTYKNTNFIGTYRGEYCGDETNTNTRSTTVLFSSPFDDSDEGEAGDEGLPEPRTGWNHNTPDDTSPFWEQPNGASNEFSKQSQSSSNRRETPNDQENEDNKLRTGWLHNTEPTPRAKAMRKEERKQTSKARSRLQQAMKEQEQNHRMISPPAFHSCGEGRAIMVTEHMVSVPIYRNRLRSPRMDVCFSIVERVPSSGNNNGKAWYQQLKHMPPKDQAKEYVQQSGLKNADDMMIYLQGGPGFGSPTPMVSLGLTEGSSWAAAALDKYSKIVLLDQRGTGRYVKTYFNCIACLKCYHYLINSMPPNNHSFSLTQLLLLWIAQHLSS